MTGEPGGGDEAAPGDVVERIAATDAFELLTDGTRLHILECLFDAEEALTFSALREAADVRDSGQFSYHLDKLRGVFVREGEDGYALTTTGQYVVGTILAGEYTKAIEGEPVPVGADCRHCGGALVGSFEEEGRVRVACEACDQLVLSLRIPPGAFEDYPREEWPAVAERWTRRELETIRMGFCPICYGPMSSSVSLDPESVWEAYDARVAYTCERCDSSISANVEVSVIAHPAVVGFHHEHGIDVTTTPLWELDWAIQPAATVVSEDPIRVEVPVAIEGDRLVLVLDETGTVVDEQVE